jgi:hypothetical protein
MPVVLLPAIKRQKFLDCDIGPICLLGLALSFAYKPRKSSVFAVPNVIYPSSKSIVNNFELLVITDLVPLNSMRPAPDFPINAVPSVLKPKLYAPL